MVHSAYYQLRSVGEFEAPLQISMCFTSWQRYCTAICWALAHILVFTDLQVYLFIAMQVHETVSHRYGTLLLGDRL